MASSPPKIIWRVVLPDDSRQVRGENSLPPALIVAAKRKLDGSAQIREGPPRRSDQPVQKRQHTLGGRRPADNPFRSFFRDEDQVHTHGFAAEREFTLGDSCADCQLLEVAPRPIAQVPVADPFHIGPRRVVRGEVPDQ